MISTHLFHLPFFENLLIPVAIIQGKALADINDALGIIVAQPQGFENHIRKGFWGSADAPAI